MIVTCPCPNSKKFEVDDSLIPKKGRLVQCGFCGHKWHFNIEQNLIEINKNEAIFSPELKSNNNEIENDINNTVIENHNDKIVSSEQDDYTEKKNFKFFEIFKIFNSYRNKFYWINNNIRYI